VAVCIFREQVIHPADGSCGEWARRRAKRQNNVALALVIAKAYGVAIESVGLEVGSSLTGLRAFAETCLGSVGKQNVVSKSLVVIATYAKHCGTSRTAMNPNPDPYKSLPIGSESAREHLLLRCDAFLSAFTHCSLF